MNTKNDFENNEQSIFREKSTQYFANENIENSFEKVEIEKKSCEQINTK
jgi:YHS domain-containing protein